MDSRGCQLIIFGGTGDLTHRKLLPAFYNLGANGLLPDGFSFVAVGRRDKDSQIYRREAREAIEKHSRVPPEEDKWDVLKDKIHYCKFDFRSDAGYDKLQEILSNTGSRKYIFYLAVGPNYFGTIVDKLEEHNLGESDSTDWPRLVIEKPFGRNLETARELNEKISSVFTEERIYRIDHYLGKEMLQNILAIRFANTFFEPLWNNKYLDNIQIVSTEKKGVGLRGGYYDGTGALRDMMQNHMLQLLTLTAMEPPADLGSQSIRDEKVKILRRLTNYRPENIEDFAVRGQYGPGEVNGETIPGYRGVERVEPDSNTETFVALKLEIDNWRWSGVPFYIKTGKRLPRKTTKIVLEFKSRFHPDYRNQFKDLNPDLLVIRIQPQEGVFLQFNAKEPGTGNNIIPVNMDFCQNCRIENNSPEAYERLLQEVIAGDQTLFTRWDEVEYSWKFIDRISRVWEREEPVFPNYQAGSRGPEAADRLLERDDRKWWEI